ncbi:MAG TPA: rhomboid family intramembrane serine protease [Solirubrobacteraceae bacterium]|nr:rhomboid family intramembrane serine protease [Solirubrobacteraceae bacterium]
MFPLRDSVPSSRPPVVNVLLIAACVMVFLFELSLGPHLDRFLRAYAFVPFRFFHASAYSGGVAAAVKSGLLSMFLHGGWLHLIGNMWFLWIFGDNVEDVLGHFAYLVFYLASGAVATLTQAFIDPFSRLPLVGASGAIAGVLGAYLVLFPWARVRTLVFLGFFVTVANLPAPLFLLMWFVIQFFAGTLALASTGAGSGGVAFFAHVGGFLTGVVVAIWLRLAGRVRPGYHYSRF